MPRAKAPRDDADQSHAQLVRPVQVLEDQDERLRRRVALDERDHRVGEAPGVVGGADGCGAERVDPRRARHDLLARVRVADDHARAGGRGVRRGVREQTRLADAGLAEDRHDLGATPRGVRQRGPERDELAGTPDERCRLIVRVARHIARVVLRRRRRRRGQIGRAHV